MKKRHVAFFIVPGHGHLNPTLSIARELISRGHKVSYAITKDFLPQIEGIGGIPIIYDIEEISRGYKRKLSTAVNRSKWEVTADLMGFYVPLAKFMIEQCSIFLLRNSPDLIFYDRFAYAGRILSDRFSVPSVQSFPTFFYGIDYQKQSEIFSSIPEMEILSKRIGFFLDSHGVNCKNSFWHLENNNIIYVSRSFQASAETYDDRFNFVGPCINDRKFYGDWSLSKKKRSANIALVSLGTSFRLPASFINTCIGAFVNTNWYAVISTASSSQKDYKEYLGSAENIEIHQYVPHLKVLSGANLYIGQSGLNSVVEAIYCGVPCVLIPMVPTQEQIADRVKDLGIGTKLSIDNLTIDALKNAISIVSANEDIAVKVANMQRSFQTAGGAKGVADIICSYF